MSALSQEARALIESVAKLDDPSAGDKARLRARLSVELGGAALLAGSLSCAAHAGVESAVSTGAAKTLSWSLAAKWVALSVAGIALTGALLFARDTRVEPATRVDPVRRAPATVQEVAPERAEAAVAQGVTRPEGNREVAPSSHATAQTTDSVRRRRDARRSDAQRVSAPPAPVLPSDAPPVPAVSLAPELKLLSEAHAALRAGAAERALAVAEQHKERFPRGVMKEERLGIEALAGCSLGRDYRAQAQEFLALAESSPLALRVRKACGL